MTKRITAEDAGGLIFDVLVDAHARGGLNKQQIKSTAGLTEKQFLNGKQYLRDELCSQEETPYSYNPKTDRYRLNDTFEMVDEYWLYRMKVAAKQMKRLLDGTASPANAKFGGRKVKRMYRHTNNLIEDLEDVIAGV